MKNFILGIVFSVCILPILEELTNYVLSWMEVGKIIPTKKVLKGNKDLTGDWFFYAFRIK